MSMCQGLLFETEGEKPKILLKSLSEQYAVFIVDRKYISVRLDKMPQVEEGVYKVRLNNLYCIVDTMQTIPNGGIELDAI